MKAYKIFTSWIKKNYSRKKKWQNRFEMLHNFAASSMNYGHGSNFRNSGELVALQIIKNKINKTNPVLFDVGANVGYYALSLNQLFCNTAQIYCFEPSENTFNILKKNVTSFSNIYSNHFALGNLKGPALLYTAEKNSEVASLINLSQTSAKYGERFVETIYTEKLDDFCTNNHISVIDFLKIDVEGFELNVLEGAAKMLTNGNISFIQFEFGVHNIDSRTYFRDFWNLLNEQYHIYRIVEDGLYEIKQYNCSLEIFSTINFIAEKKLL